MDFMNEIGDQDLLKACNRFGDYFFYNAKRFKYTPFKPIYQQGPTCGLTALGMYCNFIETTKDVDKILEEAKIMGITIQGEMFSTNDMCSLAKKLCENDKVELYDGYLDSEEIKDILFSGGVLLVPYDSDANHEPCIKDGHKAHWALISGIIECQNGTTYVLARQGKSKILGLWLLSLLAASNAQLNTVAPHRTDPYEYILPDGGINGKNGISGKSVMIFPS